MKIGIIIISRAGAQVMGKNGRKPDAKNLKTNNPVGFAEKQSVR